AAGPRSVPLLVHHPFKPLSPGLRQAQPAWLSRAGVAFRNKFSPAIPQAPLDRKKFPAHPGHLHRAVLVDALAAKVLKRVKFIPSGISQPVPANVKTAAPETQRVMFFKNQEKNDAD
ncbi:hypothetical protein U5E83_28610, partial [Raoultella planticola]|nr:hypothetical protein [Raoultella planticola]